jgi:hypothetical protein
VRRYSQSCPPSRPGFRLEVFALWFSTRVSAQSTFVIRSACAGVINILRLCLSDNAMWDSEFSGLAQPSIRGGRRVCD